MQKKFSKILSAFLAVIMMLSILPTQTFAATVKDPWQNGTVNSNVFLDALKYTGYDISQFTVNGKSGADVTKRSKIGYNAGGATGLETSSGKPNISAFEKNGMCCASYASYVYFNYLPNVYGLDTSFLAKPSNPRSTSDWHTACEKWVQSGAATKTVINKSCSSASNLVVLDKVPIGSLLIFTDNSGNYSHTGIYAGKKNGNYYQTQVGNSRGPEVQLINGFYSGPSGYANLYAAYTPDYDIPQYGAVGVSKVDDAGKAVSGAKIGVYSDKNCTKLLTTLTTNSSGNAVYGISNGEYTREEGTTYYFKEISAPTGYDISTQVVSATVVADKTTYASTKIVDNRKGWIRIQKCDDSGAVLGAGYEFSVYSDKACTKKVDTITTDAKGYCASDYLTAGTYYVKETKLPSTDKIHKLNSTVYTVNVPKGTYVYVTHGQWNNWFSNDLMRGNATVIKTSEDGVVEGVSFRLFGTSASGTAIDMTAKTDSTGKASFKNVLIGTYTVEEINAPDRYVAQKSQTVTVKNGQTASVTFNNTLKRGNIELTKVDEEYPDNKLSGAEFTVTITKDGETTTQKMTEVSTGVYRLENIAYGSECVIKETKAPTGFVLSDETFTVNITEEKTYTVASEGFEAVINRPIKGSLKIVKVDSFNNTPLEGVGYRLFNSDGEQISEGYTNENGELVFEGLRYGEYKYQEFKAPEGFVIDETVYDFSVTTDGQVITAQRENKAVEGSIRIHKTDMNGNALSDVSFLLEYSTDGGVTYQPVFSRNANGTVSVGGCTSAELQDGVLVTDENGEAYFTGLRISTQTGNILYRVTETKTQTGFQLLSDYAFEGELKENGDIDIEFTVVNEPIFVLPATGGTGFNSILIGAVLLFISSYFTFKFINKKHKKRGKKI